MNTIRVPATNELKEVIKPIFGVNEIEMSGRFFKKYNVQNNALRSLKNLPPFITYIY